MNLGRHPGSRRLATRLAACLVPLGLALALAASVSASMPPPEPTAPAGTPADETQDESPQPAAPVEFVQSWTLTPGGGPDGAQAGSRPNLSYQLAPGTSVDDIVVVYNLGNTPLDLRVYATDAFNNDDGDFDLLPGDELPSDVGSWVLLATDRVTLAPGTQATIPIRITVPPDASPGDHVGAVLASSVSTFDNGDGPTIDVDRRTGTRLYIQVDGPLNPQLAVANLSTEYSHAANSLAGSATVTFTLENRGNVRLGGRPTVSISGPFGLAERSVTLDGIPELLPGESVELSAELADVPALFLATTMVRIEPIDPSESGAAGQVAATVSRDRVFAPPITFLILLLMALIGMRGWLAVRRHRKQALALQASLADAEAVPASEVEVVQRREPQPQ